MILYLWYCDKYPWLLLLTRCVVFCMVLVRFKCPKISLKPQIIMKPFLVLQLQKTKCAFITLHLLCWCFQYNRSNEELPNPQNRFKCIKKTDMKGYFRNLFLKFCVIFFWPEFTHGIENGVISMTAILYSIIFSSILHTVSTARRETLFSPSPCDDHMVSCNNVNFK